jgi:hypothetical protein
MKQETVQGIVEGWQEATIEALVCYSTPSHRTKTVWAAGLSLYGSVIAVWPTSCRVPSMLCQLDMGRSRYATIHANYWCAQIEEENRWQITISF